MFTSKCDGERLKNPVKVMATLEDEQDVIAAKMLLAETRADKAEFDESRNVNAGESSTGIFQSHLDSEEPMDEKYIELISQVCCKVLTSELQPTTLENLKENCIHARLSSFQRSLIVGKGKDLLAVERFFDSLISKT